MQIFHNIDDVEIPFDNNWNSIAISLSGGADSALLAYLLCLHAPATFSIHVISHTRMWKTRPWQQYDSQRVFNWLVDRFPNIKFKRHTCFIAPDIEYGNIGASIPDEYNKFVSGDNIQQRSFAEFICSIEDIPAYYNAVTRNPKGVDFKGMKERDIEISESNIHLQVMHHMGRWALHPFRFVQKDWIIKQYKKFNIEDLLNITRSCEGEFEGIDYTTYTPGQYVPTCGECFWCKERAWAIDQNNK
jgi:7-cyano-7-deazaguanine synthase in queuosine biosynthesis